MKALGFNWLKPHPFQAVGFKCQPAPLRLGALLASGSALCYAELASALPNAGGDYAYLSEAFGPRVAFAWSFSMFFVIKSGSLAILGVTFATYFLGALGLGAEDGSVEVKCTSVALVVALTAVNSAGVGSGAALQNTLVASKLVLILGLCLGAVVFAFRHAEETAAKLGGGFAGSHFGGLATATVASLWAGLRESSTSFGHYNHKFRC